MLKRDLNLPGEKNLEKPQQEGKLAGDRAAGTQRGWEIMAEVEGGTRGTRD